MLAAGPLGGAAVWVDPATTRHRNICGLRTKRSGGGFGLIGPASSWLKDGLDSNRIVQLEARAGRPEIVGDHP